MIRYRIQGQSVTLPAYTCVELTYTQATVRVHLLEGGLGDHGKRQDRAVAYTLTGPATFKVGEILGWGGDVPKAWADRMIDLDAAREAEQAAARKAAEEDAARQASKAAAARAEQEHQVLITTLSSVQGDAEGNVSVEQIEQAITAAKLAFKPTHDQAERAWQAVTAARAQR